MHPHAHAAKSLKLADWGQNLAIGQPRSELYLLERRLVESLTTVIIPLDDRVFFVRLLKCAEFSSRLSEVSQTLDTISGFQLLVGGAGLAERRLLGTV
jgi:hypothetical protein